MAGRIVNIGSGNADDAFYRYKMPMLMSKIEGRGNGIKTNVINMVDVAKALSRPASYTTKFFGCELGAQTKHDVASGMSIVNGAHETAKLQQLLEGFIKRFVQCYSCGNPETVMAIDKSEQISMRCKACGHASMVDMRHKLTTFILKNPPENKESKAEKKLRRAEQERMQEGEAVDAAAKAARKAAKAGGSGAGGEGDELRKAMKALKKRIKAAEEAGDETGRKSLKKEYKKLKEQAAAAEGAGAKGGSDDGDEGATPAKKGGDEDEDEDEDEADEEDDGDVQWSTDTSREAAAARAREQLSAETSKMVAVAAAATAKLAVGGEANGANGKQASAVATEAADESDEDEDNDANEGVDAASELLSRLRAYASSHTAAETAAYLAGMAAPAQGLVALLLEALYGHVTGMLAPLMATNAPLLTLASGAGVGAPEGQRALLAGLEYFLGVACPGAAKQAAVIIKALYDADVLEEPVIDAWYEAAASAEPLGVPAAAAAAVRKQAFPFVNWLRTADSDEEDDDE